MISIIVPVYNSENYLIQCLDSLVNQSFNDFELIVVDDGSTDSSGTIIDEYAKQHSNFIAFHKKNEGQVSAYLYGIEQSKGDYIGFVDADDYIKPNMFQKMYILAIENNADVVVCNRIDVNEKNIVLRKEKSLLQEGLYFGDSIKQVWDLTFPPFNGQHMHNSRWNKIFKKELLLQNLCYCQDKVRTFEDRFIVPACIFSAKSIYIVEDNLYFYRQLSMSSKTKKRKELLDIILLLSKRQKEMLERYGLYEEYQDKYEEGILDCVGIFFNRNVLIEQPFKEKYRETKKVFNNKYIMGLFKKHKNKLCGKKGKAIKLAMFFHSPLLFAVLCQLN